MNDHQERSFEHARAIRARGVALPPDDLPPGVILDSWARCMDVGLTPEQTLPVPVVEAADLARRRDRAGFVRRLAQAELDTLSRQIAGSNFLLAFADTEGVILDLYADNRFSMSSNDAGIVAGSCWHEGVAGTNGLGTALATGSAVAVAGMEHYFLTLGDVSCTAAPVRDGQGHIVGVLNASSYYESRQRHTQALVQMAATHIENGLFAHQMHGHLVLAVHAHAEFLGTPSAGLLAFDDEGRLESVNAPARSLLTGLQANPGSRFEELFGEPLEHVQARLHKGGDVRLRDALGSALVVRMMSPSCATAGRAGSALRLQRPAREVPERGRTHCADLATMRPPAPPSASPPDTFLADDPQVAEACRLVDAAVRMGVPILLCGETGTGKELLARHAHRSSARTGAFVAVNCAALPAELFEAELFGHVGGAFTGARREGSQGLIVAADGGTLLLDEVRELPLQLQAALLRFLDDQTVRPVGGMLSRRVDVQLLAATHADLDADVLAKTFRADLLYRLNTVRVTLPALRLRRDFSAAVRWVLHSIDRRVAIADDAITLLSAHSWPGNFRELRSVLTRALLQQPPAARPTPLGVADMHAVLPAAVSADPGSSNSQLQRSAAELVRAEHGRSGGSVSRTARALGISRTTVYRHLRS